MKPTAAKSRREFLKVAATGTAGIALSSSTVSSALNLSKAPSAWRTGLKINPAIDNFRVVSCYDENMVVNKIASDFARQNEGVDTTLIEKNMDDIVIRLTLRSTAVSAWSTIFRCPTGKQWNQVKVAIKVNASNIQNMPRTAIVGKICKELVALTVLPQNITIYDSCGNAWGLGKYTDSIGRPVSGLPSSVVVSNTDKATDTGPVVPIGSGSLKCSSVVAVKNTDNSITYLPDILINCAVNKGHLDEHGGFTMAMKNHIGTIKYDCPTAQELIDINQSEAIIGQGTADIPCRQQLCIIDSLWASTTGPTGTFTHVPCRITMGTLAPIVDYLTAEKVRKSVMKVNYNTAVVNNWLSAFGYAPTDPVWIELTPSTDISRQTVAPASASTTIRISLAGSSGKITMVELCAPHRNKTVYIQVLDLRGRIVCSGILRPAGSAPAIAWNNAGPAVRPLPAGSYALKCTMGNWVETVLLSI